MALKLYGVNATTIFVFVLYCILFVLYCIVFVLYFFFVLNCIVIFIYNIDECEIYSWHEHPSQPLELPLLTALSPRVT